MGCLLLEGTPAFTQDERGAAAGVFNRIIADYERPPGAMLVELAQTLRCSTDALLGVKSLGETPAPMTARLLNACSASRSFRPP